MDVKTFMNDYFFGQPSKPKEPLDKYESFLYIALGNDRRPKIGFTIGDTTLNNNYDFVWSWTLPKPILIEKKVKDILRLFTFGTEDINIAYGVKYKTETFKIDLLTLIHITRLVILAVSGHIGHVRQTKEMKKIYNILNDVDFTFIECLNANYVKDDVDGGDDETKVGKTMVNDNNNIAISSKNIARNKKGRTIRPTKYLNVDEMYKYLSLNLSNLHVDTTVLLYPDKTVKIEPIKKVKKDDVEWYVIEYDGVEILVAEDTLSQDEIEAFEFNLTKKTDLHKKIKERLNKNRWFNLLEEDQKDLILEDLPLMKNDANADNYAKFMNNLLNCMNTLGLDAKKEKQKKCQVEYWKIIEKYNNGDINALTAYEEISKLKTKNCFDFYSNDRTFPMMVNKKLSLLLEKIKDKPNKDICINPFPWVFFGPRWRGNFNQWLKTQKNSNNETIEQYISGNYENGVKRKPKISSLKTRFDNGGNIYIRTLWVLGGSAPEWAYALIVSFYDDNNNNAVELWDGELNNELLIWHQDLERGIFWYVPQDREMDIMGFKERPTRDLYKKAMLLEDEKKLN